jgi:hypothetical protein
LYVFVFARVRHCVGRILYVHTMCSLLCFLDGHVFVTLLVLLSSRGVENGI